MNGHPSRGVRFVGNTWIFRIPGTSGQQVLVCFTPLLAAGLFALPLLSEIADLSSLSPFFVGVVRFIAVGLLLCGLWVSIALLTRGEFSRHVVYVDLDAGTITAVDRYRAGLLWEAPFDPGKLYLTETPVAAESRIQHRPALAYGDSRQHLVEFCVPTESKTLLALGDSWRLRELLEELGGEAE